MQNKEIKNVYIEKQENKEFLIFEDENKNKEKYEIFEDNDKGLRYIYNHYLIENENQINQKLINKDCNFRDCIFLIETNFYEFTEVADFRGAIFTKEASFNNATFTKEANFYNTVFKEKSYFTRTKFIKKAILQDATFTKKADFGWAIFIEEADFQYTTFKEKANFVWAIFKKEVNFKYTKFKAIFYETIFTKEADFGYSIFTEKADFRGVIFKEIVDFYNAKFTRGADFCGAIFTQLASFRDLYLMEESSFNFYYSTFGNSFFLQVEKNSKSCILNLENVAIETKNLYFNEKLVEVLNEKTNRQTFNILKNSAIFRNDQITALELHKKEMNAYYNSLKPFWGFIKDFFFFVKEKIIKKQEITNSQNEKLPEKIKNNSARIILFFEKWVSNFGTNIWLPILWWLVFLGVFGLFIIWAYFNFSFEIYSFFYVFENHKKYQNILSYAFHPVSILFDSKVLEGVSYWWLISILNFFKTIVLSFLTYEILKSFRKFSRKL